MQSFADLLSITGNENADITLLNEILPVVEDGVIDTRMNIVMKANQLIFEDKKYSIDDAVSSGIIPFLIECLKMKNDALQGWSLYMLIKIGVESKYNQITIDNGAVPILIKLISITKDVDVRGGCSQLLGHLLDQQPLIFDQCMELGLHEILLSFINPDISLDEGADLSYIVATCQPNQELLKHVKEFLPSLEQYIYAPLWFGNDETDLADISTIVCNLCSVEKEMCEMVIACGILEKLVPLLDASREFFTCSVLATFDYLAYHQKFNDFIVGSGILNMIKKILMCPKASSDEYIMEILQNMLFFFAKDSKMVQAIFESDMIYSIIDISQSSPNKKEFAIILQMLMEHATPKQIFEIIKMNAIPALSNHLNKNGNENFIEKILEAFLIVLQKVEDVKAVCNEMEEYGVVEKIKMLQDHEKQDIRDATSKLVETYFPVKSANVGCYKMNDDDDFEIV